MSRISSARTVDLQVTGSTATLNEKPASAKPSKILVPCYNRNVYRSIWKPNELRRIKTASRIVTKEERERNADKIEAERTKLEWECEQRKRFLREIDEANEAIRTRKKHLAEAEAREKVLNKVNSAKTENIAEVQEANRLILAAKCHVVRDAQVHEKQEMLRTERERELTLEKLMLSQGEEALKKAKEHEIKLKKLQEKYAIELQRQLELRETRKMIEAKQIEAEAMAMTRIKHEIETNERRKAIEKHREREQTRAEFQKASEINDFYKNRAYEEQRIAEMKAQEYQRMKREQEKQKEKEKRLAAERKQREIDRLLELQTKLLQTKNQQETMEMRRIQEQKDREFRRKEKEAAIKRKELEEQVTKARDIQLAEMKRIREHQKLKEQQEHEQLMSTLRSAQEKEQRDKAKMEMHKQSYRKGKAKHCSSQQITLNFTRSFSQKYSHKSNEKNK